MFYILSLFYRILDFFIKWIPNSRDRIEKYQKEKKRDYVYAKKDIILFM